MSTCIRRSSRRLCGAALVLGLILVAAACGDDDGADVRGDESGSESASASGSGSASASGSGSASGGHEVVCKPVGDPSQSDADVLVTLTEYAITLDPAEVPAGTITFLGENQGGAPHEFVIAPGAPSDMPVDEDGAVDEEALSEPVIGEVEEFPAQSECDGTFDLEPGTYTVFCNIVEEHDGETVAHFAEGMAAELTVT